MRVLILLNGTPPSPDRAQGLAAAHDWLVAADGAANTAIALGLSPNAICGDFDSICLAEARQHFPQAEFVSTPDQDFTDGEKALLVARERGATAITLLGATGGRMDHALGILALLLRYHREVFLTLADEHSTTQVVSPADLRNGDCLLETQLGDTISLITFQENSRVTLSGVQWPLDNTPLPIGTHGVSNMATGHQVHLQVTSGAVFLCHLEKTGELRQD